MSKKQELISSLAAPVREKTALVARIRKDSRYASQAAHHKEPFNCVIESDGDGYVVRGGIGGRYRLSDVHLYAQLEHGWLVELNAGEGCSDD